MIRSVGCCWFARAHFAGSTSSDVQICVFAEYIVDLPIWRWINPVKVHEAIHWVKGHTQTRVVTLVTCSVVCVGGGGEGGVSPIVGRTRIFRGMRSANHGLNYLLQEIKHRRLSQSRNKAVDEGRWDSCWYSSPYSDANHEILIIRHTTLQIRVHCCEIDTRECAVIYNHVLK